MGDSGRRNFAWNRHRHEIIVEGMKSSWKVKLQGVLQHPSVPGEAVTCDDMTCPLLGLSWV